ncbi:MAG: class I SAM-dependent methyltransferase [Gaiellaceae bacterium]
MAAYPDAVVRRPRAALRYLLRDREFTNLTYEIENVDELVTFVADALGHPRDAIAGYVAEPFADERLLGPLRAALRARRDRNPEPRFGRRLGWYAIVRATRPELVVETGVHDGLGSALVLRALERNGAGTLYGFDVDPQAGWLVPQELRGRYQLVLGDVRETLPRELADKSVDVFIHDSLHTYEHEHFELELAVAHSGASAILASDNAHATTALRDVCTEHGLDYALFRERPRHHFYPGAGLGLGLSRSAPHTSSTSSSVSSG